MVAKDGQIVFVEPLAALFHKIEDFCLFLLSGQIQSVRQRCLHRFVTAHSREDKEDRGKQILRLQKPDDLCVRHTHLWASVVTPRSPSPASTPPVTSACSGTLKAVDKLDHFGIHLRCATSLI